MPNHPGRHVPQPPGALPGQHPWGMSPPGAMPMELTQTNGAMHPCSVTGKWHKVLKTCRASLLCPSVSACNVGTMQSIPALSEVSACSVRTMQVMPPRSRSIGMQGIPV